MRILVALLGLAAVGLLGWSYRLSRRLHHSERDRRRAADELNRRLSELFSLQELSFILSGSLQLDRIVEQVVRYAMRFLDAQGALVALALDGEAAGGAGAGRWGRTGCGFSTAREPLSPWRWTAGRGGEPEQDRRTAPCCGSPPPTARSRPWRAAPSAPATRGWRVHTWGAGGSRRRPPGCGPPPRTARSRPWRAAPSAPTIRVWWFDRWAASGSSWCAIRAGSPRGWWKACRPSPRPRSRCARTAWWWAPW